MLKFGIGQPVPREEDARLLRGRGRYVDDINVTGQAHGYVLRSPHANAAINRIDATKAAKAPGVLAILTAAELKALGAKPLPLALPPPNKEAQVRGRALLAEGRARHVGDGIAFVIAETLAQAKDAAELIEVDYTPLPSVTDTAQARSSTARVYEEIDGNLCFDHQMGDAAAVEAAFAKAAKVAKIDIVNSRLVASSMEPRACVAEYDGATQKFRMHLSTQGVHTNRGFLAAALGVDPANIHVLTPDVGGGFGMKMFCYPEYCLAALAARQLGRAVKWASERQEAFLSDVHGRDNVSHGEVAMDKDGNFLAMRFETVANLGAYLSSYATMIPSFAGPMMLPAVYKTPALHFRVIGVYTNTVPVDAYRGAGRPEAAYVVERLVEKAAHVMGMDSIELRRRNLIQPSQMPFQTALMYKYDSGDFPARLDEALKRADHAGFEARRKESAKRGKLRGLGISTYIEACSGAGPESTTLQIQPSGRIALLIGTQSSGQGHETVYKQVVAERLGVPLSDIEVIQGDSERVKTGGGSGGSRSIPTGAPALVDVSKQVIEKLRAQAADLLEAAAVDLDYQVNDAGGGFHVVGTDRRVSFQDVMKAMPAGADGFALQETAKFNPPAQTFPNGCHVVEIEVDPDTGTVELLRYVTSDDFGTVMNPLLLAGQVHGGIVQGVGQAMAEDCVYDPQSGQLLSGSFMDYQLPRADEIPSFEIAFDGVACTTNPLGMKGAGEAGTIGATPAVVNAVLNALAPLGIQEIDMPVTPERVWRAIQAARKPAAA